MYTCVCLRAIKTIVTSIQAWQTTGLLCCWGEFISSRHVHHLNGSTLMLGACTVHTGHARRIDSTQKKLSYYVRLLLERRRRYKSPRARRRASEWQPFSILWKYLALVKISRWSQTVQELSRRQTGTHTHTHTHRQTNTTKTMPPLLMVKMLSILCDDCKFWWFCPYDSTARFSSVCLTKIIILIISITVIAWNNTSDEEHKCGTK